MKHQSSNTTDQELLAKYLQDHMVAALTGVKLFDEARKVWQGTAYGQRVAALASEIEQDRKELKGLSTGLGISLPLGKKAIAGVGHFISRLNPLNPTGSRDGLPGQLELEALHAAVAGKGCLWQTLEQLSLQDKRINGQEIRKLSARAEDQQHRITTLIRDTASVRFSTDRSL